MERGYSASTEFSEPELESFLRTIWGDSSPLAHVAEIYKGEGSSINKGMYSVIKYQDRIVGSVGIKFITEKLVELGSFAIANEHRGKNLTQPLNSWQKNIAKECIARGYGLVLYATLGSSVMNSVITKVHDITELPVYPMNVAVGVVPISEENAKKNIVVPSTLTRINRQLYTSTLALFSTENTASYENLPLYSKFNFASITPSIAVESIDFQESNNTVINLPDLGFTINIINSSTEALPKMSSDRFNQIQVPVIKSFEEIHRKLKEQYFITGFSVNSDIIYINYSDVDNIQRILNYLGTITGGTLKKWLELIKMINKDQVA